MSENYVSQREFDTYMRATERTNEAILEAVQKIAVSTEEQKKEAQETNQIMREYMIVNDGKHVQTGELIRVLNEKVSRNEEILKDSLSVKSVTAPVKWLLGIFITGAVTLAGAEFYSKISNKTEIKTDKSQIKEAKK